MNIKALIQSAAEAIATEVAKSLSAEIGKLHVARVEKLLYRPAEAAHSLGSAALLKLCVAAGWIEPVVQRRKLTLYSGTAILKVVRRLEEGQYPEVARGSK